eukprot:14021155-Ditylum_brightwellii.AAC.2
MYSKDEVHKTAKHNDEAAWLHVEEESVEHVQQQQWTNIAVEEMHPAVRKLTNWKAPGMDQVQNYWCKHMPALHQ